MVYHCFITVLKQSKYKYIKARISLNPVDVPTMRDSTGRESHPWALLKMHEAFDDQGS
jgi:hypothetical protein